MNTHVTENKIPWHVLRVLFTIITFVINNIDQLEKMFFDLI